MDDKENRATGNYAVNPAQLARALGNISAKLGEKRAHPEHSNYRYENHSKFKMQKVKDTNPLETGQTAACTKYTPLMKRDESPVHFSSNISKLFEPVSTSNYFCFQQHVNVDPFDDGRERRL